jgi:hypothetical protein
MPEPEQLLSVRERAIKVFSKIEGLDDIDDATSIRIFWEGTHIVNWPTSFFKIIIHVGDREIMPSKVYFAEGAATTKAGIQKFIAENPHKEIIIIDEIDKMPMKDQEGLLTMMERGEFTSTKVRNTQTVKAKMVIFATSNGTERLSKPLLSRFTIHYCKRQISDNVRYPAICGILAISPFIQVHSIPFHFQMTAI